MKNTSFKRMICVFITFALFMSMLIGCGNSKTGTSSTESKNNSQAAQSNPETTAASQEPQAMVFPLTTTGEKLRIATQDYSGVNISNDLPVFKAIKEKTGVDIVWEAVISENYENTIQTRLASGTDLPDMFQLPASSDPVKLVKDGLIVPIDDLMKKFAPNMYHWFSITENVRKIYTFPDGHIYTSPMMFETDTDKLASYNNLVLMLREDWLKDLGLEAPKTVDELYNVFTAFKTKDPNKNKKADEIPFTGIWSAGFNPFLALSWMYGIHPFSDGIYPDSNGKLVCDWQSQRTKDFLVEMNKWFKEGLIDADFMNLTFDKWNAELNSGTAGSTFWFNMAPAMSLNAEIQKTSGNPEAAFLQIPTPSATGYEGIIEGLTEPLGGHFAITKDCKNPELAIKWLDYVTYSNDGIMYHYFGIEGQSFKYVDGKPVILDSILNDKDGASMAKARIGMDHHYSIPIIVTNESLEDSWGAFYPKIKFREQLAAQVKKTPKLVSVLSLPEESERLNMVLTDVKTYRDEMLLKFISGETPISEFDNFAKKLGEIGMDEVLKIRQAQYDRYTSAK
jgi:ABC-type sugar transport system, periplasmic component